MSRNSCPYSGVREVRCFSLGNIFPSSHHKCGQSWHPHLLTCFYGGLVDTHTHYLFYNFILIHLSDLWMQFLLKIHFNLKVCFNFPYLINGLYAYVGVYLMSIMYLCPFENCTLESIVGKKIQHLPIDIFSADLREDIWQLYLTSYRLPKPRDCQEEYIDMMYVLFCFQFCFRS